MRRWREVLRRPCGRHHGRGVRHRARTALELAARGAHLALSDVDEAGLADTVGRCEGRGVKVTSRRLDVADRADVHAWADEVVAEHGRVTLIVNNAGVALASDVSSMSYDDHDWLMAINYTGVVNGTKAFLPHLKGAGEGHVVNISSVFGLISIPTQSAYNAAKFAVRGFTDALRIELDIEGGGVSATTVHPGGIKTNIARNARMNPELAARTILGAVERDRQRVLVGPDASSSTCSRGCRAGSTAGCWSPGLAVGAADPRGRARSRSVPAGR